MKTRITAIFLLIITAFTLLSSCGGGAQVVGEPKVVMTDSGALVDATLYEIPESVYNDVVNMNNVAINNGQPLLYVKLPTKASSYGYSSYDYTLLDETLGSHFIDTLDLTTLFCDSPDSYYYKYAESFNADGARRIVSEIVKVLPELYSIMQSGAINEGEGYYEAKTAEGSAPSELEMSEDGTVMTYNGIVLDSRQISKVKAASSDGASVPREDFVWYEPTDANEYRRRIYGGESTAKSSITGTYDELILDTVAINEALVSGEYVNAAANVMVDDAMSIQLSNTSSGDIIKNDVAPGSGVSAIIVHNLDDQSIIATMADTFTRVVALDVRNYDRETIVGLIRENASFDICISMLTPDGDWNPFHKSETLRNNVYEDHTLAVKGTDRQLYRTYEKSPNIDTYIKNVTEFSETCETLGTEVLYVQTPFKYKVGETQLPEGYEDFSNENADEFLAGMEANGVNYIDLRQTIWDEMTLSEVFYKTDHHWTAEAGFWGYTKIIDYLKNTLGWSDVDPDGKLTDKASYTFETRKDWFIAHFGQEYAKSFVGADDFTLIYPKTFNARFRMTIDRNGIPSVMEGGFYNTVFTKYYLEGDDPRINRYAAYLNGDQPLIILSNKSKDIDYSDKKVLVVKDSFANVVNPFLALNFEELQIMDVRHYKLATLTQYVKNNDFDIVIFIYNPNMYASNPGMFKLK